MRTSTLLGPPLALLLATGCAPAGQDSIFDDSADDTADNGELKGLSLASCRIAKGTDTFFEPDALLCSFNTEDFSGGSININGQHACGDFNQGFFVSELVAGEEQQLARLIVSDNGCDGPKPDHAYPITMEVRFGGHALAPRGMNLAWNVTIDKAQADAEAVVTAVIPAERWTISVDNQLAEKRYTLLRPAPTEIPLGDSIRARPTTSDSEEELDTVTTEYEQLVFRRAAAEEGEVQSFDIYVAHAAEAAPSATLSDGSEDSTVELAEEGDYVLTDTGLAKLEVEPDPELPPE